MAIAWFPSSCRPVPLQTRRINFAQFLSKFIELFRQAPASPTNNDAGGNLNPLYSIFTGNGETCEALEIFHSFPKATFVQKLTGIGLYWSKVPILGQVELEEML